MVMRTFRLAFRAQRLLAFNGTGLLAAGALRGKPLLLSFRFGPLDLDVLGFLRENDGSSACSSASTHDAAQDEVRHLPLFSPFAHSAQVRGSPKPNRPPNCDATESEQPAP